MWFELGRRSTLLGMKTVLIALLSLARSAREVRIWDGLMVAQRSAMVFDAWSTRRSIERGNGYDRNVLMQPFANSAAIYPAPAGRSARIRFP